MIKKLSIIFIGVLFFNVSYSQSPSNPNLNSTSFPTTSLTNSSSSGGGVTDVDQLTGKLLVAVPIFQYRNNTTGTGCNVTLSYDAGNGININQITSNIGLGWKLSSSGSISRQVKDIPDDVQKTKMLGYLFRLSAIPTSITNCHKLGMLVNDYGFYSGCPGDNSEYYQDKEADIFNCSIDGESVSFLIGGGITIIPQKKWKIQYFSDYFINEDGYQSITKIYKFIITKENGVKYIFDQVDFTKNCEKIVGSNTINCNLNGRSYYAADNEYYINTWHLSKIIDPNNIKSIDFLYEKKYKQFTLPSTETKIWPSGANPITHKVKPLIKNYLKRLQKIRIDDDYYVQFYYDTPHFNEDDAGDFLLSKVSIFEKATKYDYFLDHSNMKYGCEDGDVDCPNVPPYVGGGFDRDNGHKILKQIRKASADNNELLYKFDYIKLADPVNPNSFFPSVINEVRNKAQDHWGYFNGNFTGSLLPTGSYTSLITLNMPSSRDPNSNFAKAGLLEKINYSSGAYTKVVYEGNEYLDNNGVNKLGPGVRVKNIINHDGLNSQNDQITEWKYNLEDSPTTSGFGNFHYEYVTTTFDVDVVIKYPGNGQETQYCSGTPRLNTVTTSSSTLSNVTDAVVRYSRVEKIQKNLNNQVNSRIVTHFTSYIDYPPFASSYAIPYTEKQTKYDWAYGLPKKISTFGANDAKISDIINEYSVFHENLLTNGSIAGYTKTSPRYLCQTPKKRLGIIFGWNSPQECTSNYQTLCGSWSGINPYGTACWGESSLSCLDYAAELYYPITGRSELKSTIKKNYFSNGEFLETKENFTYDPNFHYLKTISSENSVKKIIEKKFHYVSDFINHPTAISNSNIVQSLIERNDVNHLLSTETWIRDNINASPRLMNAEIQELKNLNNIIIVEKTQKLKTNKLLTPNEAGVNNFEVPFYKSSLLKEESKVEKIDEKGNIIEVSKNGFYGCSIYDFEKRNVVANFIHASLNQVAYTSFEGISSGNDNWVFDLLTSSYNLNDAVSGHLSLNITTGSNLRRENLINGSYIITLWSKNGTPPTINGQSPYFSELNNYTGWTLNQYNLSVTNNQVHISGSCTIDELRLFPKGADVKTYYYEPLFGVSAEAGIDNVFTYTEYNSFGRVKVIRNQNKEIIKSFEYRN
jgi:hypothetical protein